MSEPTHKPPGLFALLLRLLRTGSGALQNRVELLSIEWRQELARLAALVVCGAALAFCAAFAVILLTAVIIFVLPESWRLFAAAGLAFLYLVGAAVAFFFLKRLISHGPFPETLRQLRQDGIWLDSLKTRN